MAIPTRKTSKTATSQGKMEKNKGEVKATPRTPAEPCPFVTRSWRVWRLVIREDGLLLLLVVVLVCVCVCARCCCVCVLADGDDDDDDGGLDDAAAAGAAGVDEEELLVPTLIYWLYRLAACFEGHGQQRGTGAGPKGEGGSLMCAACMLRRLMMMKESTGKRGAGRGKGTTTARSSK
jgi:hypothetical protein